MSHARTINCVNTLVKNQKHIPVITFTSMTKISSSASQASSLAFLIQMSYFGILDWLHVYYFVIQISKWKPWMDCCNEICIFNTCTFAVLASHLSLR